MYIFGHFLHVDNFGHWNFLSLKQEVACFVCKIREASWLSEENFYINVIACQTPPLALLFKQHMFELSLTTIHMWYACIYVSNINIFTMSIYDNTLISSMLTNSF